MGSKSWAHVVLGRGLLWSVFPMQFLRHLAFQAFLFSCPYRLHGGWGMGGREESCFLLNDMSEGDILPFHASPLFEFSQVPT